MLLIRNRRRKNASWVERKRENSWELSIFPGYSCEGESEYGLNHLLLTMPLVLEYGKDALGVLVHTKFPQLLSLFLSNMDLRGEEKGKDQCICRNLKGQEVFSHVRD